MTAVPASGECNERDDTIAQRATMFHRSRLIITLYRGAIRTARDALKLEEFNSARKFQLPAFNDIARARARNETDRHSGSESAAAKKCLLDAEIK